MSRLPLVVAAALAAALSLAGAGCRSTSAGGTGDLAGAVVDFDSRDPIVLATVTAGGAQAPTNGDGRFVIAGLPVGAVTVTVIAPGYETFHRDVEVKAGANDLGSLGLRGDHSGGDGGVPDAAVPPDGPRPPQDAGPPRDGGGCSYGASCGTNKSCDAYGACVCNSGYADCDGQSWNGCEAYLYSDAHHCGACYHDCQGGGCNGTCQPVVIHASAQLCPVLALDTDSLYTADNATGYILRGSKVGGAYTLVPSGGTVRDIGVDAANVYWVNLNDVQQASKYGGAVTTLASDGEGGRLAVGPYEVYWTKPIAGEVRRATKGVQYSSALLASGQRTSSGGALGAYPGPIVIDPYGAALYWVVDANNSGYSGYLRTMSPSGGGITDLATLGQARTLAYDTSGLYWLSLASPQAAYRYSFSSGVQLLDSSLAYDAYYSDGVTTDGSYVYWTSWSDNCIHRVPKAGGAASTVTCGLNSPMAIAVDDVAVYFTDNSGLWKVAK